LVAVQWAFVLLLAVGLAGCAGKEVPTLGSSGGAEAETSDAAAAGATDAEEAADSVDEPDPLIADAAQEADDVMDAGDAAPATDSGDDGDQAAAEPSAAPDEAAAGPPGSGLATGRPYVVIRFPDSSVDYEEELATAVRRALERRPHVAFDLVAVTPRASTAEDLADDTERARQQAAEVLDFLASLGIGADRVSVGAWTGQPTKVNEIRLYIR
jgi:hypothetical protein